MKIQAIFIVASNNQRLRVFFGRKPVYPVPISPIKTYTICNICIAVYIKTTTLKKGNTDTGKNYKNLSTLTPLLLFANI